jgi:hypothetical protein
VSPDKNCNGEDREAGAGRFGASLCISNAKEMLLALHYFRLVISDVYILKPQSYNLVFSSVHPTST